MVMAVVLVGSATAAFEVTPTAWWVCGTATGITVLYLAYLRRQTRIEEKVRRRQMHRMARARLGVENAADRERRGALAAAAPGRGGLWRSTTRTRSSSISTTTSRCGPTAGRGTCREPSAEHRWGRRVRRTGSLLPVRGYGAVGSASRSHREGQGFASPSPPTSPAHGRFLKFVGNDEHRRRNIKGCGKHPRPEEPCREHRPSLVAPRRPPTLADFRKPTCRGAFQDTVGGPRSR